MDNKFNTDLLICILLQLLTCYIIPLVIPVVILCPHTNSLTCFISIFVVIMGVIAFVCLTIFIWQQYKAWRGKI